MSQDFFDANRKLWDSKTAIHQQSAFYDMEKFRRSRDSLNPIEVAALGDVCGKSLLHLQCHFGQDSLSWAHRGATVTGVDFSPESIRLARALSEELDIPATFVEANVCELDSQLDEQFDIVFTSYGTVIWLPDLAPWARVVAKSLKPGGIFYLVDFHPAISAYDHDTKTLQYDYFHQAEPYEELNEGTYADRESSICEREYSWSHSIAETLKPLLNEGLTLLELGEYDSSPYNCFPNMEQLKDGNFRFGGFGVSTPHLFSLKLEKPRQE